MPAFIILFLLMASIAAPMPVNAEAPKGLGMWVWSHSSYSTPEARQKLVKFCVKHGISHLDVYVRISSDGGKPVLQDAESFKELIMLAGRHNITTAALRGNPRMFFSKNHAQTLRELQAIVAFSETLPGETLFKGVKYDVEPYRTQEWRSKGKALETVMRDYLVFLRRAGSYLDEEAPHLWLGVDTPFWWDKDEYLLEFEGQRKRFNQHVQDLTDFIVIMSYRRSLRKVLDCVEGERKYAQGIKKVVFPSLETVELEKDPDISFWGLPKKDFLEVLPRLIETAKKEPAMGGVMIHCYRSLLEKLSDSPAEPDQTSSSRHD